MTQQQCPKIFFTGVTGYIGGDVWVTILKQDRGLLVAAKYPSARLVYGDPSDTQLLEKEASQADIVIHCASIEDPVSSQALANGLKLRSKERPAFWICLSVTDNLAWKSVAEDSYGSSYDQVYGDFNGVSEVKSLPETAPHRDVEKIQLASASKSIKVAILCASCVYGTGVGCANRRSIQLPDLAKNAIDHGYAFKVGHGLNRWPNVHVHELSRILLALAEEAANEGGRASWGQDGYYFAENGEHVWGEVATLVAQEAQKQTSRPIDVRSLSAKEADDLVAFGALFYGSDSRCRAIPAGRLLRWKPQEHSIEAEIKETLAEEIRKVRP